MKVIYVSGKIRDARGDFMTSLHTELARQYGALLWRRGWFAFIPHMSTMWMEGVVRYDSFLKGDLIMISRCDAVFMLPNWMDSNGARIERKFAEDIGIPIYYEFREVPIVESVPLDDNPATFDYIHLRAPCPEKEWNLADEIIYKSIFEPDIPVAMLPSTEELWRK